MVHIGDKIIECLGDEFNELEINSKKKNIVDFYRGINELKEGYQPWTYLVKTKMTICMQIPT